MEKEVFTASGLVALFVAVIAVAVVPVGGTTTGVFGG
jgi:hypothetical protein